MKSVMVLLSSILFLTSCKSEEQEARLLVELAKKTFTTTAFNYTKYDLYSIVYKDTALPLKADEAPSGGSVFFRNADRAQMDNGTDVPVNSNACCLIWAEPTDAPLRVKVIWSVVFDIDAFDGNARPAADERTFKRGGPGNRWCEAVVDVHPAKGSTQADTVVFHFLPDGEVQAELGTFQTGPLPSAQLARHATPLPEGQFCKNEIDNPFYGIPRKPHAE